ncbi:ketopantoate reductase family protein [Aliidiomarina sp. Khilg15.8]
MTWVVVGSGALASLWIHGLHRHDEQVMLFSRHEGDAPRVTLTLEEQGRPYENEVEAIRDPAHAPSDARWLIMVKAWQLADVIKQIGDTLPEDAEIVLSHNGLGAAEAELAAHPGWQVYDLVTTQGAWRRSRLHSVHAGHGESVLGPREREEHGDLCMAPPLWLSSLDKACPPVHWDTQILQRRWLKLGVNCAINPLATLAGAPNGVLKEAEYAEVIKDICEEVGTLADYILGVGVLPAHKLQEEVYKVIAATADNRCSMLQDRDAGRPTEIDYLNGYIARLGETYNLPTPTNHHLWQEIKSNQPG